MNELIVVSEASQTSGEAAPAAGVDVEILSAERQLTATAAPTSGGIASPPTNAPSLALSGPVAVVLNSRMLVITLMLVAGPIGLPALWFSPRFSRVTKALFTLGFFLVTAVLPLVGAWYAFEVLLRPVADAIQEANGS